MHAPDFTAFNPGCELCAGKDQTKSSSRRSRVRVMPPRTRARLSFGKGLRQSKGSGAPKGASNQCPRGRRRGGAIGAHHLRLRRGARRLLSYDPGKPDPTNKLIEVKSTIASPLRFILTRREWDKAIEAGAAYCFHIWDLTQDPPVLHVRSVDSVAPHVPADVEKGKWRTLEIPVAI